MTVTTQWDQRSVRLALKKLEPGLKKYVNIRNMMYNVDLSTNLEFKQAFNGFYRMRQRNQLYYDTFYIFMEANKYKAPSFAETLMHINEKLNRVEASFSSKLVATINPDLPVWDKIVLNNLGLKEPAQYDKHRISKIISLYGELVAWYGVYLETDEAKEMIRMFDMEYPETGLTDTKKIDLVLWQIRE
jgi:hypothetical protein